MHRVARVGLSVASAALAIIGLGGVPDALITWSSWLESAYAEASGETGRWLLVVSAVVVLLGTNVVHLVLPRIQARNGASTELVEVQPEPQRGVIAESKEDPNFVKHDGVWWQWKGEGYLDGGLALRGPFCPNDYVALEYCYWLSDEGLRRTDVRDDDKMGGYGDGHLCCLECQEHRSLGLGKSVKQSREQATRRFEARRRRSG